MIDENQLEVLLGLSISQAEKSLKTGNYPFGAILTDANGNIVSEGFNENFTAKDITAHAEMQCLKKIDIYTLFDKSKEHVMFCSGEPCCGCSFFIARTNIKTLYWAMTDPQKEGLGDLKHDGVYNNSFFINLTVVEEPYQDLKKRSSNLLKEYYINMGKPEKANLYIS